MSHYHSQSPPPLMHPVPTHPVSLPEPPVTPGSPQGYQRFASSPPSSNVPLPPQHQQAYPQMAQAYPYQPPQQPPLQQPMGQMGQGGQMGGSSFGAWGMNDATAQFGMQLGQSAVAAGQDYVQKNVHCSNPCFPGRADAICIVRWHCPIDNIKTPLQCLKLICSV